MPEEEEQEVASKKIFISSVVLSVPQLRALTHTKIVGKR